MTRWIVGALLLANVALFAWMRWGGALTADADSMQRPLNAEQVRLLAQQPVAASAPVPATPKVAPPPVPASAPAVVVTPPPAPASAPAATEPSARVKETSCAEWGEFSGTDLARVQQALNALQLGDRLAQRNVEHDRGYWVYIPPLRNRAEVEKRISQLKARGVKDYFVVQEEGKWLNTISLGVFRTKEAAQKFYATMRAKGVRSAKLGERMSKLKSVVFEMKGLDAGTAAKLGALQKGFPGSELSVSACGN